jgi:hypothetical protein
MTELRTCCQKHWNEDYQKLENKEFVMRPFIACSVCGNKRCPKATDCNLECSGSNDSGQKGSIYE